MRVCQVTGIDETFGAIHITADGQTVPAADKKAPGKKAAGKPDLLDLATMSTAPAPPHKKCSKGSASSSSQKKPPQTTHPQGSASSSSHQPAATGRQEALGDLLGVMQQDKQDLSVN